MSAKLPRLVSQLVLAAQEGLEDALSKDAGVDFAWLAWAMRQVQVRPLPGLLVPVDLEQLSRFRDRNVELLLDLAGARSGQ